MSESTAFAFTGVRHDGTLETGVLEAPDRDAALALVRSRGVFPIDVLPRTGTPSPPLRVGADDLALGLRALASLLGAGIPLARALAVLDELVPPTWLSVLPDLRYRVEQGERLSAALGASPLPLPPHVIGVIQAGEAGSGLAAAMENAARLLESRAATRAALRNALAYPAMLAVAGSASVALLIGVVLPRFATLLTDAGEQLPWSTRFVLGIGTMVRTAWLPLLLAVAAAALWWRRWVSHPDGLARWHTLLLTAPGVGPIRRAAASASACSTLAALLDAGVPLATALPHAARATGDRAVESALLDARARIVLGERISAALRAAGALTPSVVRLVRIGEETGGLSGMLAHAARLESAQALQRLQRGIRVLEPALILLFGGVVMIVAAALLQAMYGLRPSP